MEQFIEDNKLDFIGIGVQKAATSWLFECLREHFDIRGPSRALNKEIHFFDRNYNKGYDWYHHRFEFGPWKTGEYSPSYFPDKNVPERIYRYNPNVKLLLSLRNPIDRAFSQHRHEIMQNRVPEYLYDFEVAVKQNPMYTEQGKYVSHLRCFLEFFDLDSIHIVLFDDLISRPKECLQQIYRFLGVDETFSPNMLKGKKNVSHIQRKPGLERFIRQSSRTLRELLGNTVVEVMKMSKIHILVRKFNTVKFDNQLVPPLSSDMRKRLQDIFADEIEELSTLIGRDLSNWT